MSGSSLGHLPEGKWAFDESVAECFDDMLDRSVPGLRFMRKLVNGLAAKFAGYDGLIVDMGASRGGAIASLVESLPSSVTFEAWEIAPAMLAELRARFPQVPDDELPEYNDPRFRVCIEPRDLREPFFRIANVYLSILTLQFVPIECRMRVVRDVWESLRPGGAFILVEKVMGNSALIDELLKEQHIAQKREAGYSDLEIERKRLSLEGVLVPATSAWNEHLLRSAGFREVDCFWRCLNFAGWIGVKR